MSEIGKAAEPLQLLQDVERAAGLLRAGELVAFPTETVYGLGADARNPAAVAKIFAAKGRPADHPLIVHIPDATHLDHWARDISAAARALAEKFWPGPLTLILKRQPAVLDAITGGQDTVGLRVPNHPLALELLRTFAGANGGGLAAPSANRFGRISPTTAQHVRDEFAGDQETRRAAPSVSWPLEGRTPQSGVFGVGPIAMILDGGPCAVGIESTIVDMSTERTTVLRPGMLSAYEIGHFLGRMPAEATGASSVKAPGALEAHYAPETPLLVMPNDSLPIVLRDALVKQERVAVLATFPAPFAHPLIEWHVAPADPTGFAHDLYANLRLLDSLGCVRIFVEKPVGLPWQAISDRLQRAAAGSNVKSARPANQKEETRS
ncbi:MAG: L-threonylcarbamoyladenylate synthase [Rhodocyclaceae bacterium]|nr:L-threonylcarbamoyladenylate synthase [Rhodocyclaceae bacterium]